MTDSTPAPALAMTDTFVRQLIRLGHQNFAGTLFTEGTPADMGLFLTFHDGNIVDLIPNQPPSFLERALLVEGTSLSEKDRKRVAKQALQNGKDPGLVALEQGLLNAEEVATLVIATIEERIGELIAVGGARLQAVDRRSTVIPSGGVSQHLQLAIEPEQVLIGAARRRGLWNVVREHLPCLKDVYYATPSTYALFETPERYPLQVAVLSLLDGRRDLLEVIEGCDHDPFLCIDAILALHQTGHVELINPVQLYQLGCEREGEGNVEKALRHFERAEERGLDDFDIGYKLGETYQAIGRKGDAIERFLVFAEKCVVQFRIEDTIRACQRIIEIDPENLEIQERYLSLLARYGKSEDAVSHGVSLAQRFQREGQGERARTTLEKILELAEANEEVLRLYLELCQATSFEEGASRVRKQLGALFHQREDAEKALELFQGLFVGGDEGPEVRSKLVELHYQAGSRDKAREHLLALKGRPGWKPKEARPEAVELYRKLLDMGTAELWVTKWLIDEARHRQDRPEMARLWRIHRNHLEAAGEIEQARNAAEHVTHLVSSSIEDARALATLERRSGNLPRAGFVLENLLRDLKERDEKPADLPEIVDELVEVNPHSLLARHLKWELDPPEESTAAHQRLRLETLLLEWVAGNDGPVHAELETASSPTIAPFVAYLSGLASAWRGDGQKALEWLLKAGRLATRSSDRGLLQGVVHEIEKINPELRGDLDEFRRTLSFGPIEIPAAERGRGPRVVQAGVSNITARLKNLQSGGSPPPDAAPLETRTVVAGGVAKLQAMRAGAGNGEPTPTPSPAPQARSIGSSIAKLKGLQSPTAGTAETTVEEPPAREPSNGGGDGLSVDNPKPKTSRAVGSAASKLRGLKSPGSDRPETEPAAEPTTGPAPASASAGDALTIDNPAPKNTRAVGSAASKLKGLKSTGVVSPSSAVSAPPPSPERPGADPIKVDNPEPKNSKKLGSAASRLSALRGESST